LGYVKGIIGLEDIFVGIKTKMTLVTGNQLKAARALAGVDQQQVADSAGVNVNTIRNMEARGAKPITSSAVTVRSVQLALEALGIEFLNHAQPGVRLRTPSERTAEMAGRPLAAARKKGRRRQNRRVPGTKR
jgi:transcriptional regulator with XRE-family HTH domain